MSTLLPDQLRFLVIDENPDTRFLYNKTLLRVMPDAAIVECQIAETAFRILRTEKVAAIISHRTVEFDGASLVRELRKISATVPIVMTSGIDRKAAALEAGATCFFLYDEWLRIGTFVRDLIVSSPRASETG